MYEKRLIAQIGDPILRKKTFEVKPNTILSKRVQNIIKNLIFVMRKFNGAGLAANQIFYNMRICVIEVKNNKRYKHIPDIPLTVLINPKIKVNCLKIDLPIRELLPLTLAYTDAIGNVRNK